MSQINTSNLHPLKCSPMEEVNSAYQLLLLYKYFLQEISLILIE